MYFNKLPAPLITILATFQAVGFLQAEELPARPNVLFIAIDDMNDWTGFLGGHPQAQTPHMDRLAKKGVNFTNAHCSAPGCSPSRNALLYGVEPYKSGFYAFYDQDKFSKSQLEDYTSLPEFFKNNGYATFGSGKIHHRRNPTPVEWTEFYDHKAEKKKPMIFDDSGYRQGNSSKMNFKPTLNPLEDHNDYKYASFGTEILSREHAKPFFLAVGIVKPHLAFVAPKQFFDLYPDPVKPPRIRVKDHEDIPAVGRAMAKLKDDKRFKSDGAWNEVRRAYLACISWADHNVGRLIEALEASPYADNTVVVLWSDHGYSLGEKNHFRKFALWEETTRVPFIIWDTRDQNTKEARVIDDGVSLINIYKTLADLSGLKTPDYVDGFSLAPQMLDPSKPFTKPAICSWGRGNYTVRDKDWRYTRYYNGGEELYHHLKDSDEWTNLSANPKYAAHKKRLASYLPVGEVPMVKKGIETWSVPVSADKPLTNKKKTKPESTKNN